MFCILFRFWGIQLAVLCVCVSGGTLAFDSFDYFLCVIFFVTAKNKYRTV